MALANSLISLHPVGAAANIASSVAKDIYGKVKKANSQYAVKTSKAGVMKNTQHASSGMSDLVTKALKVDHLT